jgi:hypothetical protein
MHMFHMASALYITLIQNNVLKVCLHNNWYKRPKTTSKLDQLVTIECMAINTHGHKIHDTTRIYDESLANSEMPLFRGRPLHHVDTRRTSEQFVQPSYPRIRLFIADITVV